ncbi:MAG: diadenylate cyclase CdaA [Candidatus Omnitrophota bacterium]|nr:diadenylate cyclase CdaA [Candidatus Omnitrophota bacterium]
MLQRFINIKTLLEILILWMVIYRIFISLKGTRGVYLIRGIIVLIIAFFVFQKLGLTVLSWLLTNFFAFYLITIVIIFQPELRAGLIQLGQRRIFYKGLRKEEVERVLREIVSAVTVLSRKKTGALIAIKKDMGLSDYIESGVILNAQLSSELLQNIFHPLAPLHDGGVVIEGAKIVAASCLFPHSDSLGLERTLGMRHRSAIGLSEHSDAVIIVVSEENGHISLAINGQLTGDLTPDDLLTILKGQISKK